VCVIVSDSPQGQNSVCWHGPVSHKTGYTHGNAHGVSNASGRRAASTLAGAEASVSHAPLAQCTHSTSETESDRARRAECSLRACRLAWLSSRESICGARGFRVRGDRHMASAAAGRQPRRAGAFGAPWDADAFGASASRPAGGACLAGAPSCRSRLFSLVSSAFFLLFHGSHTISALPAHLQGAPVISIVLAEKLKQLRMQSTY
jgi:hypothetical protein